MQLLGHPRLLVLLMNVNCRRHQTAPSGPAAVLPPGTPASGAPAPAPTNQAAIDAARLDRVYIAVFLSMASPDYLIQK